MSVYRDAYFACLTATQVARVTAGGNKPYKATGGGTAFARADYTDFSRYMRQVTLNQGREEQDPTTMGAGTRLVAAGLKTWSFEMEINTSFDRNLLEAGTSVGVDTEEVFGQIWDSDSARTYFLFQPRPNRDSGGVVIDGDGDHPEYIGSGVITSFTPIQGSVGDWLTTTVSLMATGPLVRVARALTSIDYLSGATT